MTESVNSETGMDFIIDDRKALYRLRDNRSLRRTIRRIKIGPSAGIIDRESLESQINKSYFACGCRVGAIAVYAALVAVGAGWWRHSSLTSSWWKVTLLVLFSAVFGKFSGLSVSRYRLNQALHTLDKLL